MATKMYMIGKEKPAVVEIGLGGVIKPYQTKLRCSFEAESDDTARVIGARLFYRGGGVQLIEKTDLHDSDGRLVDVIDPNARHYMPA